MKDFCRVYSADVAPLEDEALFRDYFTRVPSWRQERIDAIRHPEGKRLSLGVSILLTRALASAGIDALSERFAVSEKEKPFLPGHPEIFFSLSHAGTKALCAVSGFPVGCDAEAVGRGTPRLAARYYTPDEQALLTAETDPNRWHSLFTGIWTKKESYLKATGDGLSRPLNSFSVISPPEGCRFFDLAAPEGFRYSCCLLGDAAELPRPEQFSVSL